MSDLIGRRVEYNTGKHTGKRHWQGEFIWDVGRIRAIARVDHATWELLIEEHDGQLITSRHDEIALIGEERAAQLEKNRRARRRRTRSKR